MAAFQQSRFPCHLATLVARRLAASGLAAPPDAVLLRLFETLYFASLKTNETRPCTCTINYLDPATVGERPPTRDHDNGWTIVPFQQPFPLNVRSLLKLADAADPMVSSIAVYADGDGELFIWALVDQEVRYGDYVSLDGAEDPRRPGVFQAAITGVGAVSAFRDFALLGSLEQDNLIDRTHDVLWGGPIHLRLRNNLDANLLDPWSGQDDSVAIAHITQMKDELLVRWQNAICRVLYNIQQYGHGGGLLIVPHCPPSNVSVKYEQRYDRLPKALFRLAQHQLAKRQLADTISSYCNTQGDYLPCDVHFDAVQSQSELERLKQELLGCVRYIASLSRVNGFVLLDDNLVVHGFGVEARARSNLTHIHVAGDAKASVPLLREAPLSQFGTRHRAMLRYCDEDNASLGFVISQDGEIRAAMKHQGRLVLWENINVQLAYRAENRGALISNFSPHTMTRLFHRWVQAVASRRSA